MLRMQVKYCEDGTELNKFLESLYLEDNYPRLHNIVYIPRPDGVGSDNSYLISGNVIAAVQYVEKVGD